jgi:uncharacterized membrane-anchored protein
MREKLERILKGGLFITIGGQQVNLPFDPKWPGIKTLFSDIQGIITIILIFSSVVAVGMIIVSAYTLITASGDPEKIEQGQKTLTAAIVGLIVVWLAALIVSVILKGVGVG